MPLQNQAGSAYIEPGSPWQNPFVESFGSRVRDELLAVELFDSLAEAKLLVEDWRIDYNTTRPHPALRMLAPARFAEAWRQRHADGPPVEPTAVAASLRSPSGLALRGGGDPTTTLRTNPTTDSRTGWTDERGPVSGCCANGKSTRWTLPNPSEQ